MVQVELCAKQEYGLLHGAVSQVDHPVLRSL